MLRRRWQFTFLLNFFVEKIKGNGNPFLSFHSYFSWQTFLLSWWRASTYSGSVRRKLVIKSKKDKGKGKGKSRERDRRGGGECGQCTVLACPPHPTQSLAFSLYLFFRLTVEVEKPSTNIGYFLPFLSLWTSYAIVYVCSLFSLLANGCGGVILWISWYYLIPFSFSTFILLVLAWFGLCIWVGGWCLQVWIPSSFLTLVLF